MEQQQPIPEEEEIYIKPVFAPSYYIAHLVMLVYIITGVSLQLYQYYFNKTYRLLSIATWPWVLTSSAWVLLSAVIIYGGALYIIARNVRGKLAEMEISWYTLLPYILFAFVWLAMFGRLFAHLISPEGIFVDPLMIGK